MLSIVVLSIPLFMICILIEWAYRSEDYRINDAVTNVGCGIVDQVVQVWAKGLTVFVYYLVYTYCSLYTIPHTISSWIVIFLLADLAYYWMHRKAHEISLFWGGHAVHHQSEDYNLSVALRQGATQFCWAIPFYLPMALMGFSTQQFFYVYALVTVYQFWIHTEAITTLGPLEWIFNTPSHHRVHHGRDPKYIDKNYAGVLIIWDRLFGTFQQEEERPHYGVTTPINTWDPIQANLSHYRYLATLWPQMHGWKEKLRLLFDPPGWLPERLGGRQPFEEVDPRYRKYDRLSSVDTARYVFVQFIACSLYIIYFLFVQSQLALQQRIAMAMICILTPSIFGALLEGKKWAVVAECTRLSGVGLTLHWTGFSLYWIAPIVFVSIAALVLIPKARSSALALGR